MLRLGFRVPADRISWTRRGPRLACLAWPIVACWGLPSLAAEREMATADALVNREQVLVIAHRGDSRAAPENTLPAFESAVRAGADLVELDYHHTADGVPIVLHDYTLDRTTDACTVWSGKKLKVLDKSSAELARLDAGTWFNPRFAAARLPTLEQALEVIQRGAMTLVERKGGDAATCIELLRRKELLSHVVVQSFDWSYLEDCHRLHPELVLAALGHGEIIGPKWDRIAATGARIVAWHEDALDAPTIADIHDRGYKAWAFTVNNLDRAGELARLGIDGLISDTPGAVRAMLEQQSVPTAATGE